MGLFNRDWRRNGLELLTTNAETKLASGHCRTGERSITSLTVVLSDLALYLNFLMKDGGWFRIAWGDHDEVYVFSSSDGNHVTLKLKTTAVIAGLERGSRSVERTNASELGFSDFPVLTFNDRRLVETLKQTASPHSVRVRHDVDGEGNYA